MATVTTAEMLTIRMGTAEEGIVGYFKTNIEINGEHLAIKKAKKFAKSLSECRGVYNAYFEVLLDDGKWKRYL